MPQPRYWLDEIIDALRDLGGRASLSKIYARIEERGRMDFNRNRTGRSTVRRTIEQHSSATQSYTGERDVFYPVEGLGNGIWGLRKGYI